MTSSPKRPWFQFQLATGIVVVLAASAIIWANLRFTHGSYEFERGWPFSRMSNGYLGSPSQWYWSQLPPPPSFSPPMLRLPAPEGIQGNWYLSIVLLNFLAALAIGLALAAVSEYFLRRRGGRKP